MSEKTSTEALKKMLVQYEIFTDMVRKDCQKYGIDYFWYGYFRLGDNIKGNIKKSVASYNWLTLYDVVTLSRDVSIVLSQIEQGNDF